MDVEESSPPKLEWVKEVLRDKIHLLHGAAKSDFKDHLKEGGVIDKMVVVKESGKIVGWAATVLYGVGTRPRWGVQAFVLPAYRRQGIGKACVEKVIEDLQKSKLDYDAGSSREFWVKVMS